MKITLDIPDELVHRFEAKWGNLEHKMLELLLIEAYRDVLISAGRLKQLLKFSTSLELDAFLKAAGVYLHYNETDFEEDIRTLQELRATQKT